MKIGKVFNRAWPIAFGAVLLAAPALGQTGFEHVGDGNWYTGGEVFFLHRSTGSTPLANGDDLSNDANFPEGETLLDSGDLDMGFDPGGRVFVGYRRNARVAYELGALFQYNSGRASISDIDTATGTNEDLDAPFVPPNSRFIANLDEFSEAAQIDIELESHLYGFEINYRRGSRFFSFFAGPRAVLFGDELTYTIYDDSQNGVIDGSTDVGRLMIETRNIMVGGHVGLNMHVPLSRRISISGRGAVGLFANFSRSEIDLNEDITESNPVRFRSVNEATRPGGLVELSLAANWQVFDNATLSVGYNVMALFGVTTAPKQFPQSNTIGEFTHNRSGSVLYHGPMARFVYVFGPARNPSDDGGPGNAFPWYVSGEFMMMRRSTGETLLVKGTGVNPDGTYNVNAPLMDSSDLDNGFQPGARLAFGARVGERQWIEFGGLFIHASGNGHFADRDTANGNNEDLDAPFVPPTSAFLDSLGEFEQAALIEVDFDSTLYGFEVNYRRGDRFLSLFGGPRFVILEDDLTYTSFDDSNNNAIDVNDDVGRIMIHTQNVMVGGHFGANVWVPLNERFSITGRGAIGAFANFSRSELNFNEDITESNPRRFDNVNSKLRMGGLIEVSVAANWHVFDGATLSVGYGALALFGVTAAPQQFPQANTQSEFTQNTGSNILYHGPMVRFVWVFGAPEG